MICGVAFAALASAAPAFAQDEVEAVVVTGSRIPQPNLVTTSPVTQVTSADINTAGVTRVEDLVNQLPQAFAAQNSTVANGASGTATVDLRGLGSDRTLVLIDGRRMPYGSPLDAAADLNQIPGQLVDRVEVLTGGASAVYGSDAISGVVNFIMKKDFEGIQVDAQYSFFQHHNDFDGDGKLIDAIKARAASNPSQFKLPDSNVTDGDGKDVTLIMGVNAPDGKGNLTAYASYRKTDAISQANRDFSSCSIAANPGPTNFLCGGSGTSYPGEFTNFGTGTAKRDYTIDSSGGGNTFRTYNGATDAYNFGPINYYQRPDERYSIGAMGHYEINQHADVYTQLMFTDYQTVAQIAPSGSFFTNSGINCDNPLLSAQQVAAMCDVDLIDDATPDDPKTVGIDEHALAQGVNACVDPDPATPGNQCVTPFTVGRRNVEGGGRQDDLRYQSYRIVTGVRGLIAEGWNYDVSAQYSRVQLSRTYRNEFLGTNLKRALDVVSVGGVPTCRSVVDGTDPRCVPYDIFSIGGVTQDALNYLQVDGLMTGSTTQQVVTASVSGDLTQYGVKTPWATTGFQTAFGVEYRRDTLESSTDQAFASGDLTGQGGPTIGLSGVTQNYDIFAEARLPLIEDAPFAKQLSIDAAYRFSDYNSGINTDTYKVGADWAPIDDVRFRASYQRATRAPNVIDLYTAQGFNLFDMDFDPCGAGAVVDLTDQGGSAADIAARIATRQTQCARTGLAAGKFGSDSLDSPAGQYNYLQGGSTLLKPETATTYTIGVVFTPTFFSGFSATIDYFNIDLKDRIDTFGADTTLTACLEGSDAACGRVHRNANGQLWTGDGVVDDLNINTGGLKTAGVDVAVNYSHSIGSFGSMSVNFQGTYLDKLYTDVGEGAPKYDCTGFYGNQCGIPSPKWRHRARLGWQTPWNADVALTWRYYGEVELFGLRAGPGGTPGNVTGRVDSHFDAENYFDLAGNWTVRDGVKIRAGVNNILDNDPQLSASVGTTGNGNTYPQTYDTFGRYVFMGVTLDF